MTLPVSAEYPQTPLLQYDAQNPPYVPIVKTIEQVRPAINAVVSAIANEASIKANMHAGRMMFYNLCNTNYWNNIYFQEVVQTALDLITLSLLKQRIRFPEQGINDAVNQAVSGMVSMLFYQYQELKSMINHEILNAVDQNVHFFNNLKQEIIQMQHNTPGYGAGPVYDNRNMHPTGFAPVHMQPNAGYHPQQIPQHMVPSHMQPYPNNGFPHGVHAGYHGGGYPQPVSNYPAPSAFGTPNGMRYPEPSAANIGERHSSYQSKAPIAAPAAFNDNVDSRYSSYVSPHAQRQQEQPITAPVKKVEEESITLIIDKGSEMDRAQHQITYFADSYIGDATARSKQFTKATEGLSGVVIVEDNDSNDNIYLDESIYVESNQEAAIVCGVSKQFERQNFDSSLNVFRCFAVVVKPVQCAEDISKYLETIRESSSFTHLSTRIQSIAKALHIQRSEDPELDTFCNNVISFLSHIDRLFMNVINDFLKNKLQLSVSISNFCEDVPELGNYLYSKYGPVYSQAYQRFEGEVLEMMLESVDEDVTADIGKRVVLAEGLTTVLMPMNYSMTYICMNERELGYMIKDKPLIIDPNTAPNLHKIASSLPKHSKQRDFPTLVDLLITADGAVFKLHASYLRDNEFLISKA